ncbi:TPA: hypothetical protein ACVU4T_003900 [Vibrio parahaemolyticus]|uniref:hypothetical protein n=1 Tax=Vibrio harveyi group TaxID=717610 RepID=UPI000CE4317D|nr:hypothetical protein [Vibrio jasicida]
MKDQHQTAVTITLANGQKMDCDVSKHHYQINKQVALELYVADTERNRSLDLFPGEPMGIPTVCLPEVPFEEDETTIKDCDEYAGFLDALAQAGVVRRTARTIHDKYLSYPVVEVLI